MIMVQAYIAVFISKFLYKNPEVIDLLLKIAIAVFAFFCHLLFYYRKAEKGTKAKGGQGQ